MFTRQLLNALLACVFLHAHLTYGEVIIELDDGQQITVPVDEDRVKSIRFGSPDSSSMSLGVIDTSEADSLGNLSEEERRVLRVGPARKLKTPSDAAKIARDGDVIEIDSGVYTNDYATWRRDDLTIRGVGDAMAHLKSTGRIPNGKAIWITRGNNIQIENIEFSGAAVKDTNGAGIRHEGGDIKLHNTFFHDNEFSILSGKNPQASIEITSSRFWFQKRPVRFSHGIYIGKVGRFTLKGSHVKGTDKGQQVKSRALENYILYNRIEDVPGGNSSRLVDLSNCGFSIVMGNDLHQASTTENNNVIGYGPEGCQDRTGNQKSLFVVNNTLVNEARQGTLVRNFAGGDVTVANNFLFGKGSFLSGEGTELNNFREELSERSRNSWDVPPDSDAIDRAIELPPVEGIAITPIAEFQHPVGYRERTADGNLDAGSREKSPQEKNSR